MSARARCLGTAGVVLLAALLRLGALDRQSFWTDEGLTARFTQGTLAHALDIVAADYHPPAYFLLMNLWRRACGSSATSMRLLSALFGVLAVWMTLRVGRRLFGTGTGLLAGACAAVSTFQIYYSQEARPYGMLIAFAALSMDAYTRLYVRGRGRDFLWYLACSIPLLYVQYFGAFVLLAQNLHYFLSRARPKHASVGPGPGAWILSQVSLALAFSPWVPTLVRQSRPVVSDFWMPPAGWRDLGDVFLELHVLRWRWIDPNHFWIGALVLSLAGVAVLRLLPPRVPSPPPETASRPPLGAALILLWLLIPILVAFALNLADIRLFHRRSLSPTAPALALGLACLALRPPSALARILLASVFLALPLATAHTYYATTHKHDFRGAAAYVKQRANDGALIGFLPRFYQPAFEFYFGPGYQLFSPGRPVPGSEAWLIVKPDEERGQGRDSTPREEVEKALGSLGFRIVDERAFRFVDVYRFQR